MRLFGALSLCCALALSGCGDWPDIEDTGGAVTSGPWPVLQPLDTFMGNTAAPDMTRFDDLAARAARLRQRAAILRSPVTDQASFDRLRDRLDR